jgi:predicted enzyme related to lactoylglutathione lyase
MVRSLNSQWPNDASKIQYFFANFVIMDAPVPLKIKSLSPLLLVSDLPRSLQYYNRLGFETTFVYDDFYAGIEEDGHTIHLKCSPPDTEKRESKQKHEHLDIAFTVEDIAQLHEAIKKLPVNIVQPLRQMPYGKEIYIADPDGNILGFVGDN